MVPREKGRILRKKSRGAQRHFLSEKSVRQSSLRKDRSSTRKVC